MSDQNPKAFPSGTVSNPNDGTSVVWRRYFGSTHPSGLNAVYGDGSVRFTSFNVDAVAWMRACVIDDGESSGNIN